MRTSMDFFDSARSYIEHCRRHYVRRPGTAALHLALWGLRHVFSFPAVGSSPYADEELHVAFALDGGLGDVLVNARFVEDFCRSFGPVRGEVYTPLDEASTREIFADVPSVQVVRSGPCLRRYDLVLTVLFLPCVELSDETRLLRLASPGLREYVASLRAFQLGNAHWFSEQDSFLADMLAYGRVRRGRRVDMPYACGTLEPGDGNESLPRTASEDPRFAWGNRPFFTVSRGSGSEGKSTKLWAAERYDELLDKLHRSFPQLLSVQLGSATDCRLRADVDLRGSTDFRTLSELLGRSLVHVSPEGGLVHLRHRLRGGPSVVLFGPTDPDFYGYPENCNLRTPVCLPCEWVQRDWQQHCMNGHDSCLALESLSAGQVFEVMMNDRKITEALCSGTSRTSWKS